MERFQINLTAARVNANLTQLEMAKQLKVDRSTIHSWEKGRTSPTLPQLRKISELSHIPMDYIFLPDTLPKVE